nr:RHS repeat-associated core domain-containing protein [Streptomyces fuscichromogenes]
MWTRETDGSVPRDVADPTGGLAATTSGSDTTLQLCDIRGDVAVQLDLATTTATAFHYDENGNTQDATGTRYGWLGASRRASDTPSGLTLMGARLYTPATGCFLSQDPVEDRGANAYSYCSANPVDCSDIGGTWDFDGVEGPSTKAERDWCYWPSR